MALGYDLKRVRSALACCKFSRGNVVSMDAPRALEDSDGQPFEVEAVGQDASGDGEAQVRNSSEFLSARSVFERQILRSLTMGMPQGGRRAAEIVRMRYGFGGAPPKRLGQIAEVVGLTNEAVRGILMKSVSFLRRDASVRACLLESSMVVPDVPQRSGYRRK